MKEALWLFVLGFLGFLGFHFLLARLGSEFKIFHDFSACLFWPPKPSLRGSFCTIAYSVLTFGLDKQKDYVQV